MYKNTAEKFFLDDMEINGMEVHEACLMHEARISIFI